MLVLSVFWLSFLSADFWGFMMQVEEGPLVSHNFEAPLDNSEFSFPVLLFPPTAATPPFLQKRTT